MHTQSTTLRVLSYTYSLSEGPKTMKLCMYELSHWFWLVVNLKILKQVGASLAMASNFIVDLESNGIKFSFHLTSGLNIAAENGIPPMMIAD